MSNDEDGGDDATEVDVFEDIVAGIARLVSRRAMAQSVPTGETILDKEITFDKSLPGLHTYLGEDVVNVDNRNHIDPGTVLNLRAFYSPGIILVPGYTLPMHINSSTDLEVFRSFRDPVTILPGCFSRQINYNDFVGHVATVADLASIRPNQTAVLRGRQRLLVMEVKFSNEVNQMQCRGMILPELSVDEKDMDSTPFGSCLIPPSWSRFLPEPEFSNRNSSTIDDQPGMLCPNASTSDAMPTATRIMVDPPIEGSGYAMLDTSFSTWRLPALANQENSISREPVPGDGSAKSGEKQLTCLISQSVKKRIKRRHKLKRYKRGKKLARDFKENSETLPVSVEGRSKTMRQSRILCRRDVFAGVAHSLLPLPSWVYRQYDTVFLIGAIRSELSCWTNTWRMDHWSPLLAIPFSYWLVQNLPLSCSLKARLLKIDHVVQRLRAAFYLIKQFSALTCSNCKRCVTSQKDIICLAKEGSLQTYVNSHGIAFDMMTLGKVIEGSICLVGNPTANYSWFPGYAWTIAECAHCYSHMGWLFTATSEELRPRLFWGIKRSALEPGQEDTSESSGSSDNLRI